MSKVSSEAKEWYRKIDESWPKPLPKMDDGEAVAAGRRLYRFAFGKKFTGKIRVTHGNRYTWIKNGVLSVNPDNGWDSIVHLMSHYAHSRLSNERPHSAGHAVLEYRMVRHVIDSGWLDGRFKKPEQPKPDRRAIKLQRAMARLSSWERKAKRANTAIKKLRKQIKYYEVATRVEV